MVLEGRHDLGLENGLRRPQKALLRTVANARPSTATDLQSAATDGVPVRYTQPDASARRPGSFAATFRPVARALPLG